MKAILKGTSEGIRDMQDALKFCQDFARFCYSDKSLSKIEKEKYNSRLTEDILLKRGHHSPIEQFTLNFVFEDLSKALAMVLNNQRFCATTEKSARYTFIPEELSQDQSEKYMKWYDWFNLAISEEYPEKKFPRLYVEGSDKKTAAQKLSQENARYMGSVFIPTRMGHKMDLSHLNKIVSGFETFIDENIESPSFFEKKLAIEMQEFLELPEIKQFTYEHGFPQKGNLGLNLFGPANEEYFGEIVYSSNDKSSLAALAQRHRHRTIDHHIIDGYQLGAPLGFFIPPMISKKGKREEWINDLREIAKTDIPQGQLVYFGFSGNTRELPMMTSERLYNNAQLETNMGIKKFIEKYLEYNPSVKNLLSPDCQNGGCTRGGCYLGPAEYDRRVI